MCANSGYQAIISSDERPGYEASMHAVILQCLFCHALASQPQQQLPSTIMGLPVIYRGSDNFHVVNFCVSICRGLARIPTKIFYMVLSRFYVPRFSHLGNETMHAKKMWRNWSRNSLLHSWLPRS